MNLVETNINALNDLCKDHKVKSLYVFGSVLNSKFNEQSDIDFIIEFDTIDPFEYAENYFDIKFKMQDIFKRPIDLLEAKALSNPYLLQQINQTKKLVYGH